MWKVALFGSTLLLWLIALGFILLCAHDLVGYLPGRERWFALTLNIGFLALSVLLVWLGKCFKHHPQSSSTIAIGFVTFLFLLGLWAPLIASVSGPPWEHKLNGMPVSAGTPFMDSVWAWEVGDISK